jgi:hypothetical protein
MPNDPLLPGVTTSHVPPAVVFDSRNAIRRARRRRVVHDVLDVVLLAAVDALFVRWPSTHVPFFDRGDSLLLLGALNVAVIGYLWLARVLPAWSARRVAATWSVAERTRFLGTVRT